MQWRRGFQRLLPGAGIEHSIGKDMAALEIGSQLNLVDCQKGDVEIARHSFGAGQKRGFGGLIFSSPVISATVPR